MSRTSTEKEINIAYKKLALKYHPDRTRGDEEAAEKFKEIATAYAVRSAHACPPPPLPPPPFPPPTLKRRVRLNVDSMCGFEAENVRNPYSQDMSF